MNLSVSHRRLTSSQSSPQQELLSPARSDLTRRSLSPAADISHAQHLTFLDTYGASIHDPPK